MRLAGTQKEKVKEDKRASPNHTITQEANELAVEVNLVKAPKISRDGEGF